MTLKLSDDSEEVCKSCSYDHYGFRQCEKCAKDGAEHTAKLISWAKRVRAYLEKELPHVKSSLERFESTLGHNKVAQETVIPRLKKDIAELEQLLGEVED